MANVVAPVVKSDRFLVNRLYTFYTTAGVFTGVVLCIRDDWGVLIAPNGPTSFPITVMVSQIVAFEEYPAVTP